MIQIANRDLLTRSEACQYVGLGFTKGVPFLTGIGARVMIGKRVYFDKKTIDTYVRKQLEDQKTPLERFVSECFLITYSEKDVIRVNDFWHKYKVWCIEHGLEYESKKHVKQKMAGFGVEFCTSCNVPGHRNVYGYKGIKERT